jgi:hypothetical protein
MEQSSNTIKNWESYLQNNNWTTYLAYEINFNNSSKQQSLSQQENSNPLQNNINKLYQYEALLTQCSYLSRMAYCPADIFCRMTEHLDITPNAFNDYIKAIEDIYEELFKYKCSYDSKYIQENPKFIEKFNPYYTISPSQQTAGGPTTFNTNKIKKNGPIGYFIQNKKKLNVYLYLHHNKQSNFNNGPTLFISFKGSSNFKDFGHDLKSAVSKSKPLSELNNGTEKNDAKASSVFIDILKENDTITNIFNKVIQLIQKNNLLKQQSITEQEKNNKFLKKLEISEQEQEKNNKKKIRIIITGHSLGGALAELFGYYLKKYKSEITCPIHIITFGACCVFNAAGRNEFNTLLNISGDKIFTLDRITVNADPVVLLPVHLDHGGYTLLKIDDNDAFTKTGRTNEIGKIREMLGLNEGSLKKNVKFEKMKKMLKFKEETSKENYDGNELLVSEGFIKLFKNSKQFTKTDGTYNFELYKSKYKNIIPNIFKNKNKKLKIKQEAMPNLKQTAGEPEPQSTEFRKNTKQYKQETLNKMPNQINYSCYKTISKGFCHGVYMGVSYMKVLRLIGDKEPVKDYILYKTENGKIFSLPDDGNSFSHTNSNRSTKEPLINRITKILKPKKNNQLLNSAQTSSNSEETAKQQSGFSCSIL